MKKIYFVVLFCVIVLACSASNGSEFIGKWQNIQNSNDTMEFIKNGKSFLLVTPNHKVPVTLQPDGTLVITGRKGSVVFSHVKKSDTIIIRGQEYKRLM
jgi:hypothetical protein